MTLIKLFPTRAAAKPASARFEPLARSAFRTLGLRATASQPEVFDAASSVRLALKLDVSKTFEGDLPWLEPVARGESEVRDALGRLSEPAQRARERLFWFHGPLKTEPAAGVAELMRAVEEVLARAQASRGGAGGVAPTTEDSAASLHDAALLALAGLARLDPDLFKEEAWGRAFALWRRLSECEEFWSLLVAADLKGDYEQPVTFGEVAELRLRAPRLVSAYVFGRALDAAQCDDARLCLRALRVLRGAALPRPLMYEYEREAAGPFEDALTEKLDAAFAWAMFMRETDDASRRNYSNQAWRRFEGLRTRLAEFVELAGADSPPTRRVLEQAASKLLGLAENFERAGRRQECLFVCMKARALAPPGCEELAAIEEKLRALGAGAELRERAPAEYAAALGRELADARVPPKLFRDDPKGAKTLDGLKQNEGRSGCLTNAVAYLLVAAACFGLQWCGLIQTRTPYTPPGSLPRIMFTPQPVNLNLNLNYNVAPLDLRPYLSRPLTSVRPRGARRGSRRRAGGAGANENAQAPRTRAGPNLNATRRE